MNDYEVGKILKDIEIELILSMKKNLLRHLEWEKEEGFDWGQWQALKIRELREFRARNSAIMKGYDKIVSQAVENDLKKQFYESALLVDQSVKKAIKEGYIAKNIPSDDFFKGENKKLRALIDSVSNDMNEAKYAALRSADDVYRQVVFQSATRMAVGSTNLKQAVDKASKDFLERGIAYVEYKNGRKVGIDAYARMAVRTANKRTHLMGEGERRKEWGVSLVKISSYLQSSDICAPWQGRVYIDDVYSGGTLEDGDYPLLSQAIDNGLFHPNCRHTSSTYYEGISEPPKPSDEDELKGYEAAKKEAYIRRNIQKYKRLEAGSLDINNVKRYNKKRIEWEEKLKSFLASESIIKSQISSETSPIFLGKMESITQESIISKLEEYEKVIRNDTIENAIVITKSGEIYQCFGDESRVFPDLDLGDKLLGASVTHNHPIEYTEFSFSEDDFKMFEEYNLNILRGTDSKYLYELNRNGDVEIDKDYVIEVFEMIFEKNRHTNVINNAKESGVGYWRKKIE